MVSGDESTAPRLRPAAPPSSGPSAGAGATGNEATPTDATSPTESATTKDEAAPTDATTTSPSGARRLRIPFAHAVRCLPPPRRAAASVARAVGRWSRRPSGRLALPGLLLLILVAATGTAGALLVPATAGAPYSAPGGSTDPDLGSESTPSAPAGPDLPGTATIPPTGTPPGAVPGRPSDVLTDWARQIGARINAPAGAVQAYGYAEWVLSQTTPGCKLRWTTLAAIGKVESDHGRANGAVLGPDGRSQPKIIGLPLDGADGRKMIADTDRGVLDGDRNFDRAVGPMQFIPTTWQGSGVDADSDGVKDPNDIDDAALAAANYLCGDDRDLSTAEDWWKAILSYNNVRPYAQKVFDTANEYGLDSRT